jgi:hypothetical protein
MPGQAGKKRTIGNIESDNTLTAAQRKWLGFRSFAHLDKKISFRYPSNPTKHGYDTGYHESAVTTDTFNFLRNAKQHNNETHQLPSSAPVNSFFGQYVDKTVNSTALEWTLRNADGFRTDTAQTILSLGDGTAAAHSGSGLDLKGQAEAHNLLRAKIMELLFLNPKNVSGFTERALITIFASMTVTLMAPGEVARSISGGTNSLKAGNHAKGNWEINRNEAKRRVEEMYEHLMSDEKKFVNLHANNFMHSIQGANVKQPRHVRPSRATSPERCTTQKVSGEVAGGSYISGATTEQAMTQMPTSLRAQALWSTRPLRALR